jgi:hypothetical protein
MIASMRIAVFLLVLANLLFFVWTRGYLGTPANPDARRAEQQLLADQVLVVSRGEPPGAGNTRQDAEKAGDRKSADSCQSWTDLASADADRVERLLSEKFAAFKVTRRSVSGEYWLLGLRAAARQQGGGEQEDGGTEGTRGRGLLRRPGQWTQPAGHIAWHLPHRGSRQRGTRSLARQGVSSLPEWASAREDRPWPCSKSMAPKGRLKRCVRRLSRCCLRPVPGPAGQRPSLRHELHCGSDRRHRQRQDHGCRSLCPTGVRRWWIRMPSPMN